ncbi:cytochrome P450 [Diaporthe helianthi]|uniref:Cytochrome P450 n=1 Tax=Diaporthe helianthi TaxID=158607 RepID=A0A2P5HEN0_DIAHE|nr:cytochrome P450 [Diaporthe helianthi]
MVRAGLKADRDQRTPEFVTDRFKAMGKYTFGVKILGTSNLITAEPKNVQSILATQFNNFAMGKARQTNLKIVLGRSIFAVDGEAWNSAREALRPIFSRENIAKLEMLEKHIQRLLACIEAPGTDDEGWTKPVGLANLFPSLTLDSATELFLGHSTNSLLARLNGEALQHNFHWAFERVLATLSIRMRLRSLYWLYGNRELKDSMEILNNFVDDAIRLADLSKPEGKYDYLNTLRERCADQAEFREQVLGLLAAGVDTTASLMSWVFYCLVRNPRVLVRLRIVVLEDFGEYTSDSEAVARNITFQKLKNCQYLQYVMKETLRLHTIVPFNSRMAAGDTILPTGGGQDGTLPVFVPAGTEVNFSTHVMHRRSDLWGEDADEFVPERWESQFALTEAGFVIVRLLQRYNTIEGLDVDAERDYCHFTLVAAPGTPKKGDEPVKCRLKVADREYRS